MELTQFKALTFDVIGTLINHEQGLLDWMQPRLAAAGKDIVDDDLLVMFSATDAYQSRLGTEMPFPKQLPFIWEELCARLGIAHDPADGATFTDSVDAWPAFPDSVEALAYLRQHFHLVTITNGGRVATGIFAQRLGSPFHKLITSEDMGTNKPHPEAFAFAEAYLNGVGVARAEWLHVAQSQYHDIVPARALGIHSAWIERRHGRGYGASPVPPHRETPDFHFHSLAQLAQAHRAALAA
ncbi:HAD-IA family hydrolase [Zavarzinia sp. CC-PAN008]|uniref:HAD-IA family hydrolase n=1 Tax=Zavarzinia sp. CC-PAN008 TaxID=3243332 RepID=UPI003F748DFC